MSLSRWCPIWMHLEGLLIWLDYRFCQLVWFLFTDFDCLGAAAAAAFFSGKIVYKPNCSQKTKNIPPKFYPSRPIVTNFFKSRPPSSICLPITTYPLVNSLFGSLLQIGCCFPPQLLSCLIISVRYSDSLLLCISWNRQMVKQEVLLLLPSSTLPGRWIF